LSTASTIGIACSDPFRGTEVSVLSQAATCGMYYTVVTSS